MPSPGPAPQWGAPIRAPTYRGAMIRRRGTDAPVDRRSRMWWLAPVFLVATTAVAATVLFVPRLGAHVVVPGRLVVAAHPERTTPPPRKVSRPKQRPTPAATGSATTSPSTEPSTEVVQPERPVVRLSDDSGYDDSEREPGDR